MGRSGGTKPPQVHMPQMTKFMTKDFSGRKVEGKQSFNYVTGGKKMEFINHLRLSGVGIHVLIYCQIVAGSVV